MAKLFINLVVWIIADQPNQNQTKCLSLKRQQDE